METEIKAYCGRCNEPLEEIIYIEPDWKGVYREMEWLRHPLCKSCWEKADAEARLASKG